MQTKHRAFLSLGLAAASFAIPYAHAVTTSHTRLESPVVSQQLPAPASPCTTPSLSQALVSTQKVERFTRGPLSFSLDMGMVTSSCWSSQDDMIFWNGDQLASFNRATQQATIILGTENVLPIKHRVLIVSLSPNGRWLVWAGGVDGHSTWDAVSIDGTEHRQWPRAESNNTPAVAWMQDNTHWVELSVPETQVTSKQRQYHRDNMRARVYSLDSSEVQDFPLQLEVPDPSFILPSNFGGETEFLFTSDGHAWLTENWESAGTPGINECSLQEVYQLLPSPTVWKLHKTYLYPKADANYWMFDSPARSPDDNWIVWRNFKPDGKSKWRLMLSRTDGSDMRTLYQSDRTSGGVAEWSPDSRQIAFTDNGLSGICTINLDQVIADDCTKTNAQQRKIASVFGKGPFPVSDRNLKPFNHSLVAAQR